MNLKRIKTPLLDLALKGDKIAKKLCQIPRAIMFDLEPPLIVLNKIQQEELRKLLEERK